MAVQILLHTNDSPPLPLQSPIPEITSLNSFCRKVKLFSASSYFRYCSSIWIVWADVCVQHLYALLGSFGGRWDFFCWRYLKHGNEIWVCTHTIRFATKTFLYCISFAVSSAHAVRLIFLSHLDSSVVLRLLCCRWGAFFAVVVASCGNGTMSRKTNIQQCMQLLW